MTRKDFKVIAKAVKRMKSLEDDQVYVANMLALELSLAYEKFDADAFLKDCGVEI